MALRIDGVIGEDAQDREQVRRVLCLVDDDQTGEVVERQQRIVESLSVLWILEVEERGGLGGRGEFTRQCRLSHLSWADQQSDGCASERSSNQKNPRDRVGS